MLTAALVSTIPTTQSLVEAQGVLHLVTQMNQYLDCVSYQKLVSRPGEMMHYRAFGVLWQMACDIELLHKVQYEGE